MARSHQKTLRANNINRAQRQAAANYMDKLEGLVMKIVRNLEFQADPDEMVALVNDGKEMINANHTDSEYVRP